MDWLTDSRIYASLLTLTTMEIALGVDNLVFIAILASRAPPERHRQALDHAKSVDRARPLARNLHACDAAQRRGVQTGVANRPGSATGGRIELPSGATRPGEGVNDGADSVACGLTPAAISAEPLHAQLTPSSAE